MQIQRFVAISQFIACLWLIACCDRNARRIQPHWLRAGDGFYLHLLGVGASSRAVPITDTELTAAHFASSTLSGEIRVQEYGFWLDLVNNSDKPILLLWPEARYVDEAGKAHEVYAPERGDLTLDIAQVHVSEIDVVNSGERRRPTVMPIYKQYMVGCRKPELFSEPLVPTRLDDKDEIATKYYVQDLAKRQIPVKLLLPIEVEGSRNDYIFAFVLKPRGTGGVR